MLLRLALVAMTITLLFPQTGCQGGYDRSLFQDDTPEEDIPEEDIPPGSPLTVVPDQVQEGGEGPSITGHIGTGMSAFERIAQGTSQIGRHSGRRGNRRRNRNKGRRRGQGRRGRGQRRRHRGRGQRRPELSQTLSAEVNDRESDPAIRVQELNPVEESQQNNNTNSSQALENSNADDQRSNEGPGTANAGEATSDESSPFISQRTAFDYLASHGRVQQPMNEQRNEQNDFGFGIGESLCEIWGKHLVRTPIGGRCE